MSIQDAGVLENPGGREVLVSAEEAHGQATEVLIAMGRFRGLIYAKSTRCGKHASSQHECRGKCRLYLIPGGRSRLRGGRAVAAYILYELRETHMEKGNEY